MANRELSIEEEDKIEKSLRLMRFCREQQNHIDTVMDRDAPGRREVAEKNADLCRLLLETQEQWIKFCKEYLLDVPEELWCEGKDRHYKELSR